MARRCATGELKVCRACFPGEDSPVCSSQPEPPRVASSGRCAACRPPVDVAAESQRVRGDQRRVELQPDLRSAKLCLSTLPAPQRVRFRRLHVKDGSDADSWGAAWGVYPSQASTWWLIRSLCSGSGPSYCTLRQAIAKLDADHRYIVLRKGASTTDFGDLQIGNPDQPQGLDGSHHWTTG
jgi:hypothetical protein